MQKQTISARRLHAMQRVESHIAAHPGSTLRQIGRALGLPASTLNGYTLQLRALGRIVQVQGLRSGSGRIGGSQPDTFRVAPGLAPLPLDRPLALAPPTRAAPLAPVVQARRMDLVAALFGPVGGDAAPFDLDTLDDGHA